MFDNLAHAWKVWEKAGSKRETAWTMFQKAEREAFDTVVSCGPHTAGRAAARAIQARAAYRKADAACDRAWDALKKAADAARVSL